MVRFSALFLAYICRWLKSSKFGFFLLTLLHGRFLSGQLYVECSYKLSPNYFALVRAEGILCYSVSTFHLRCAPNNVLIMLYIQMLDSNISIVCMN